MSWTDDITTARDNAAATLATVLASPRPTYTVGDQTFEWSEYVAALSDTVAKLTAVLNNQGLTPFEVSSEGIP